MAVVINTLSTPQSVKDIPKEGKTRLCAVMREGNLFIVDQHGELIQGTIGCKISTAIDCISELTLTAYCHKLDSELDNE